MGKAGKPTPVVLFVAVLYAKTVNIDEIQSILTTQYGPIQLAFGPVAFSHSEYYKNEMGLDLYKLYLTFESYIDRDSLAVIKTNTNDIESHYLSATGRTVNIDPGYIARDKLVLASTKDFYHRIYLANGIFAEVTLHYRHGAFRFFSWTYPDYKDAEVLQLLEKDRARLVKTLRD